MGVRNAGRVYRSTFVVDEARTARLRIDQHQADRDTGRCVVCGQAAPCAAANEAAEFLAQRGLLTESTDRRRDESTPLLTHVWRVWLAGRTQRGSF